MFLGIPALSIYSAVPGIGRYPSGGFFTVLSEVDLTPADNVTLFQQDFTEPGLYRMEIRRHDGPTIYEVDATVDGSGNPVLADTPYWAHGNISADITTPSLDSGTTVRFFPDGGLVISPMPAIAEIREFFVTDTGMLYQADRITHRAGESAGVYLAGARFAHAPAVFGVWISEESPLDMHIRVLKYAA